MDVIDEVIAFLDALPIFFVDDRKVDLVNGHFAEMELVVECGDGFHRRFGIGFEGTKVFLEGVNRGRALLRFITEGMHFLDQEGIRLLGHGMNQRIQRTFGGAGLVDQHADSVDAGLRIRGDHVDLADIGKAIGKANVFLLHRRSRSINAVALILEDGAGFFLQFEQIKVLVDAGEDGIEVFHRVAQVERLNALGNRLEVGIHVLDVSADGKMVQRIVLVAHLFVTVGKGGKLPGDDSGDGHADVGQFLEVTAELFDNRFDIGKQVLGFLVSSGLDIVFKFFEFVLNLVEEFVKTIGNQGQIGLFHKVVLLDLAQFFLELKRQGAAFFFRLHDEKQVIVEAVHLIVEVLDDFLGTGQFVFQGFVVMICKEVPQIVDRRLCGGIRFVADVLEALVERSVGICIEQIDLRDGFDAAEILGILAGKKGVEVFKAARKLANLFLVTHRCKQGEVKQDNKEQNAQDRATDDERDM